MSRARATPRRPAAPKLIDDALLRRWPLPTLEDDADKVSRGDVLVVGGSVQIPGAALLAATAALRAGAGRVQLATARGAASALASVFPEGRVIGLSQLRSGEISGRAAPELSKEIARCRAALIGPGMREHALAEQLLRAAQHAKHEFTAVLDAAALRVFRDRKRLNATSLRGVIATPHAGEMADLWGCDAELVKRRQAELAAEAARTLGITLVLKGVQTLIVDPDGVAFQNLAGNPGLATAGSGDVLAGIIAALAARGADPIQAAVWGVYVHAKAGDALQRKLGPLGYLARELPAELPRILGRLSAPRRRSSQAR